jgi:hypothetical protein
MSKQRENDHWLARPGTIRLLWRVFAAVLAALVVLQLVVKVKGYFTVDAWFAFGAAFGFLACAVMVLVAKALGYLLKRPEDYYSRERRDV